MAYSTGLAFSGGGIRSAAFCSGVLHRLLSREVKVDYLSCVSGGGYTGTGYLDWKYREESARKTNQRTDWHENFFKYMRENAGYLCHWQKHWTEGILDAIILFCLVLLVTVIEPIIMYGSYSFPVAFIIDYLFGKCLRSNVDCDDVAAAECGQDDPRMKPSADQNAAAQANREHCRDRQGADAFCPIILFFVLFILFVLCFVLAKRCSRKQRYSTLLDFIYTTLAALLALTFFPFSIHDFMIKIPLWTQYLLVFIGVMVWFFLPLLRSKTSYVLIIYCYSYVIYWKVYEAKLLGIEFSGELFNRLLFMSGLAMWLVPLLSASHKRLVHVYNRWRLQKAFYHPKGLGTAGCSGITMPDVFPVLFTVCQPRCCHKQLTYSYVGEDVGTKTTESLNLSDLKDIKPKYLSNIVVNRWKESEESENNYELLIMSPTEIERLDRDSKEPSRFEGKLEPADVKLSDAMATSAAALSEHMGKYDQSLEGLSCFPAFLGLEMGATLITDLKSVREESALLKMLPFLVEFIRCLPLICVAVICYSGGDEASITVGVISFFVLHFVLAFIAVIDTGKEHPKWLEKMTRWFIVHNDFVNYVREMFSKDNCGPMPPPVMLLSDGGHIENLGLLPLLKKQLKKIIVVDGGYKDDEKSYGKNLLNALTLARKKLGCSFLSGEDGDVISDLMTKFIKPNTRGKRLRYYKFKVQYKRDASGHGRDGEILLIVPRKPEDGVTDEEDGSQSTDLYPVFDEPDGLSRGMFLKQEDVDKLTFCCCECCHRSSCRECSSWFCKAFPQHITANQFFTPLMFEAYHREGFRACTEAKADEFINEKQQIENGDRLTGESILV